METRLAAAGEDRIGVPSPDQLRRLADCGRSGRARGDRGVVRPAHAELERNLAARGIDEHAGNEVGRDPIRAPLAEEVVLLGDPRHSADCRAEEHPHARRLVRGIECRVGDRLLRRRHSEHDVAIEPARFLRPDDGGWVEPLHLRRDPHRIGARVERLDEVDPAPAGDRGLPGRAPVVADRRHGSEPGHGHPPHAAETNDWFRIRKGRVTMSPRAVRGRAPLRQHDFFAGR